MWDASLYDDGAGLVTLFPKLVPSAAPPLEAGAAAWASGSAGRGLPGSGGEGGSFGPPPHAGPAAATAPTTATAATGLAGFDSTLFDSLYARRSQSRIDAGGYTSRSRSTTLDSWGSCGGPRLGGSAAVPLAGSAAVSLALLPPGELDAATLLQRPPVDPAAAAAPDGGAGGASLGESGTAAAAAPPVGEAGGRASVGCYLPPLRVYAPSGSGVGSGTASGLLLPLFPTPSHPAGVGGLASGARGEGGGMGSIGGVVEVGGGGFLPGPPGSHGNRRPAGASTDALVRWPAGPDAALTDSFDGTATRPGAGLAINWEMADPML